MMLFWIISAAMILAALAMLAPPLLRNRRSESMDRDQQNVVIARERLAELESEKARAVLTAEQFEQAKGELEQSLLRDLDEHGQEAVQRESAASGRLAIAAIVLLVPAITLGLYAFLGSPQMVVPVDQRTAHAAAGQGEMPSVEEMLEVLVARLKETPEDSDGWFLLGRTYMAMNKYAKAAGAFEKLHQLVGEEPVVLLAWADAAAMSRQGDLSGRPAELIRRAVILAPDNQTALWLGGMVEEQAGNHQLAIDYWERLLPQLQDDPESLARINSLLAAAREQAGMPAAAEKGAVQVQTPSSVSADSSGVRVRVALAAELLGKVGPEEVLFIYAKALQGPKMPLAAARHKVKDLPLELTLDDSSAMLPAMKLSNFEQVLVGARISRSGDPIAQSGDLKGEVSPVEVGAAVDIVIDSLVP